MKTTPAAVSAVIDRITALHPADVPCIEVFEESLIVDPFIRWRDSVVALPE